MVQSLWKTVWQILIKLNLHLPYDLATTLLGIYPRDENFCLHKNLYTIVHTSFTYNSQKLETGKMSFKR